MQGLNKVTLIGNLGNDPEIKQFEKDILCAKFSMATTEMYKDALGKRQTLTEWHSVILWRGLAELAQKYLRKGSTIYLEGKIKTRQFISKVGEKKYVTEIIGEQILLMDRKAGKL